MVGWNEGWDGWGWGMGGFEVGVLGVEWGGQELNMSAVVV